MRARRASGSGKQELLRQARRLRDTIDPLLPTLTPGCPTERFDRRRGELEEVRALAQDSDGLARAERRGDPMARALAGLLRFDLHQELPALLVARTPGGDVSFAPLGPAPKEMHIAVQQFDDPVRLLAGYLDWVKRGYHFYAGNDRLYSSGPEEHPPSEFLSTRLNDLPYKLARASKDGRYACTHLVQGERRPKLTVSWTGAGLDFSVCRRCARADRQLYVSVTEGIAVPRPKRSFEVSAEENVDCHGPADCVHRRSLDLPRALQRRYRLGLVSDRELLEGFLGEVSARRSRLDTPTFVAAGVCYGSDVGRFVEALAPSAEEKVALERTLPSVRGLFEVDEASASRALERLWPNHAETIVSAIVPDPARSRRLVDEARAAPGRVSELLHRAAQETAEKSRLAALPRYARLVPEAAYVDRVAREFRAQGAARAERGLLERLPREGKERGLGFGLLVALGRDASHQWQFSPTEQEFGRTLAEAARRLLEVPAEAYDRSLGALLQQAGVTNWGDREPGS